MTTAPLLVRNAGLVLTAPFLPHLFALLDLTTADPTGRAAWRSIDAQARAVRLTQILVDGRSDAPISELPLNRLLCGMPEGQSIAPITPSEAESEECQALLRAMIAHWPQLSQSSPATLQETFLQREGRISEHERGPLLTVERNALDVLLDTIPWSYSVIRHPWMPQPLTVNWG